MEVRDEETDPKGRHTLLELAHHSNTGAMETSVVRRYHMANAERPPSCNQMTPKSRFPSSTIKKPALHSICRLLAAQLPFQCDNLKLVRASTAV